MSDERNQSIPSRLIFGRTYRGRGRAIRYAVPGVVATAVAAGAGLGIIASPVSDTAHALPGTPVSDSIAIARSQDRPARETRAQEDRAIEVAPAPTTSAEPAAELSGLVAERPVPKSGGQQAVAVVSNANVTSKQAATGVAKRSCAPLPGVRPNTEKVHQASCARFPGVTGYLGVRPDSDVEHPSGRAVDIMLPNTGYGQQIADYMRANAASLGVTEVIFNQRIWTTQRASEGWRLMSNRGSATANHMDHVHVSVR